MTLDEYKAISPVFEEDIYYAISMETCVDKRNTIGAPGPKAMQQVIAIYEEIGHKALSQAVYQIVKQWEKENVLKEERAV